MIFLARKKGNTIDNKERRLQVLEKILEEFNQQDKKPRTKEILTTLKKKGFDISKNTLYNDYTELAINATFVQDLASKSYSKLVHDCFDTIDFAERKARDILEKKWTRSKTVTKTDEEGNKTTETHTTEELAEPHLDAIQQIRECAVAKVKLLGGDIIKVSAKKWSIQRQSDIETIAKLKSRITEMERNDVKH